MRSHNVRTGYEVRIDFLRCFFVREGVKERRSKHNQADVTEGMRVQRKHCWLKQKRKEEVFQYFSNCNSLCNSEREVLTISEVFQRISTRVTEHAVHCASNNVQVADCIFK
jgi:hypothetical protein